MLLVELTGATSEVGLLRWIFIPVSWAASSRLPFLMGVWGVGAQQTSPQTKYVCPLQHRPPNPNQTESVFAGCFPETSKFGWFWRRWELAWVAPDKARV